MRLGLGQNIKLAQELRINPRLYQAMDLLYMPLLDLQQHLKQELVQNPFLELVEPTDGDQAESAEKEADENEVDWEKILLEGFETGGRREEYEQKEYYEPTAVASRDLYDHLRDQLTLLRLTPRQILIGQEIIGNIDENGMLSFPLQQIVDSLNQLLSDAPEALLPSEGLSPAESDLAADGRPEEAGAGAESGVATESLATDGSSSTESLHGTEGLPASEGLLSAEQAVPSDDYPAAPEPAPTESATLAADLPSIEAPTLTDGPPASDTSALSDGLNPTASGTQLLNEQPGSVDAPVGAPPTEGLPPTDVAADAQATEAPAFTLQEIEEVLRIIQSLDPAGIAARDLRESLLLQLRDKGMTDTLAHRIVEGYFSQLVNHRWAEISKALGVKPRDVQEAADEISKLDPKPGLQYTSGESNYIVPDLVVEKVDGEYIVFHNDTAVPRLRLSQTYREIARDKSKFKGENKEFISNKLNSANWMIQAIEQRRQTMLKVMNFIVDRQRDFFEDGIDHLKPLTLREVAEVIDMHESTVSRVTNQKYAQTPRGVFRLKFFFSSGLSTDSGEDVSARGIKARIQKLVGEEDSTRPLTDRAIVDILKKEGINIARRTVAKYRDQLGILSARMRKRI